MAVADPPAGVTFAERAAEAGRETLAYAEQPARATRSAYADLRDAACRAAAAWRRCGRGVAAQTGIRATTIAVKRASGRLASAISPSQQTAGEPKLLRQHVADPWLRALVLAER